MEMKLNPPPTDTAGSSNYGTPIAATPNVEISPATPSTPAGFAPEAASATSTPLPQKQELQQQQAVATPVSTVQPITSPLPNTPAVASAAASPAFATQLSSSSVEEALIMPDEEVPEPENPQVGN